MVGSLSGGQKRRLSLLTYFNHPLIFYIVSNDWHGLGSSGWSLKLQAARVTSAPGDPWFFNQIDVPAASGKKKSPDLKDGQLLPLKSVDRYHQDGQTIEQYFREEMNKGGEQAWKIQLKQVLRNKRFIIHHYFTHRLVYLLDQLQKGFRHLLLLPMTGHWQ